MPVESRMQQIISAIARYHPSFPDEVEGCTPGELARLGQVVDRPVPESYADFARHMGHRMGQPPLIPESDFTIETITSIHAERSDLDPPARYFLIGTAEAEPYADFFLDTGVEGEPHVVRFPTPPRKELYPRYLQQELEWLASSLHEWVFTRAYYRYRVRTFQNERHLDGREEQPDFLARASRVLDLLGFTRQDLSTPRIAFHDRSDAAVVAVCNAGTVPYLHLVAHSRKELVKLADILGERLRLRPKLGE